MAETPLDNLSDPVVAPGPTAGIHGSESLVSVIMANRNGEAYLERAMRSVLDQTHRNLELIISDDGSTDGSTAIIRRLAAGDPRVHLIAFPQGTSAGAARNRAIDQARGDWIAICDSDDILHPERLSRLVRVAGEINSDLIADDLIHFGDDPLEHQTTLLQILNLQEPVQIDAMTLVTGRLNGRTNLSFGYLKPMIRSSALRNTRYNENLRVDEDYDLYLRLLIDGCKFTVIPDAMYLYRRHSKSTSHRANAASLERIVQAQADFLKNLPPEKDDLARAIRARMMSHARELSFTRLLDTLKRHAWASAAMQMLADPRHIPLLLKSLAEHFRRRRLARQIVRQQMNLVLCAKGRAAEEAIDGFTVFEVPDLSEAVWSPSAAWHWVKLAQLSCEHDLCIVAADKAGKFALGLVPEYDLARIDHPRSTARPISQGSLQTFFLPTRQMEGRT